MSPVLSPLLRRCPTPSPALSAVVFHCCPAAVSHYFASAAATKWILRSVNGRCEDCSPVLYFFCSQRRIFFCPIAPHASKAKYRRKKLRRIEGANTKTLRRIRNGTKNTKLCARLLKNASNIRMCTAIKWLPRSVQRPFCLHLQ